MPPWPVTCVWGWEVRSTWGARRPGCSVYGEPPRVPLNEPCLALPPRTSPTHQTQTTLSSIIKRKEMFHMRNIKILQILLRLGCSAWLYTGNFATYGPQINIICGSYDRFHNIKLHIKWVICKLYAKSPMISPVLKICPISAMLFHGKCLWYYKDIQMIFKLFFLWINYKNCLSSFIHPWSNSFVLIRISILSHLSIMWQSCDNVVPIYLTPMSASSLVSSAIPPGLSDTVMTNRMSRPSAAKPRSMTRPRAVVSMLPPHSATTTLIKNGNG